MNSRQAQVMHQNDIGMRMHIFSPTVPQPEQYDRYLSSAGCWQLWLIHKQRNEVRCNCGTNCKCIELDSCEIGMVYTLKTTQITAEITSGRLILRLPMA